MAKSTKVPAPATIEMYNGQKIETAENADVIAAFPLSKDIGVISVSTYREKRALDIRRFYLSDQTDTWCPTSKGIRIDASQVDNVLYLLAKHTDDIKQLLAKKA